MKKVNEQKGFALLIAVLVAGVLVAVTYMMFSISLKQMALGTSGKNSQTALFMADTGLECALYLDSVSASSFVTVDESNINCDTLPCTGNAIILQTNPFSGLCFNGSVSVIDYTLDAVTGTASTSFKVVNPSDTNLCAIVEVGKYIYNSTELRTSVSSRGYNICPDGVNNNPLRLERGLEAFYP